MGSAGGGTEEYRLSAEVLMAYFAINTGKNQDISISKCLDS